MRDPAYARKQAANPMEGNLQLKTRLMLQMPVHLKKLSTGQDSRCGVREKEGIWRAGSLIKNVILIWNNHSREETFDSIRLLLKTL